MICGMTSGTRWVENEIGERMMTRGTASGQAVIRVGAPVLEAVPPPIDTPAGRFQRWLGLNHAMAEEMLDRMAERWDPLGCFLEVNFDHPDIGPAGAIVMMSVNIDIKPLRRRAERVMVIPFGELGPYLGAWERGETILVSVGEMPEPLARRYATTPVEWSLNVPIAVEGTWVGLVGATTDDEMSPRVVAGFEALAGLLMRRYAADAAWEHFQATLGDEPRLRAL